MRWVTLVLCYNGWLALCLAMPKYSKHILQQDAAPPIRHLLGGIGWGSLAGSLAASVSIEGWSFGPVEWIGQLAVTGMALVFMLPYAPRVALTFGVLGFGSAVALWLS